MAVAKTARGYVESAATKAVRQLGYTDLKPEQLRVVAGIVDGCDVFAVQPTGFGKSLCFACLPLVFDLLMPDGKPSFVLAVTPLTAVIRIRYIPV